MVVGDRGTRKASQGRWHLHGNPGSRKEAAHAARRDWKEHSSEGRNVTEDEDGGQLPPMRRP